MQVIKPPQVFRNHNIFLAGSIEMGKAIDWQTTVTEAMEGLPVTILNPRRDDWDSSWEQTIENDKFREQVEWELDALEHADIILMYFDPETKSPISLLELGLHAESGKMVVICPDGFWRKGNVDIICNRHDIPLYTNLTEVINLLREDIRSGNTMF